MESTNQRTKLAALSCVLLLCANAVLAGPAGIAVIAPETLS